MSGYEALKVFAWEDRIQIDDWVTTETSDANSTETNGDTWDTGDPLQLRSGFVIRDSPTAIRNDCIAFKYPSGSTQWFQTIPTGGYGGSELATAIDLVMGVVPGMNVTFSGNKFTLSAAVAFDLNWTYHQYSRNLAATLGFDPNTDLTGAMTYTSSSFVYCKDCHWLRGQIPMNSGAIQAVMAYSPNISGSADTITLYGHDSDLGADWRAWDAAAAYKGTEQSAWNSGINDIHVWLPNERWLWWAIFVKRLGPPTATSVTKIGTVGFWDEAWYDGATSGRDHAAPWVPEPAVADLVSRPAGGGAHTVDKRRGDMKVSLPFRGWDRSTAASLLRLYTRYGKQPHLWIPDPSGVEGYWNSAAFAYIERFAGPQYSQVENIADFDIDLRTVSMHPWET